MRADHKCRAAIRETIKTLPESAKAQAHKVMRPIEPKPIARI
jgi:hypothetical protein